MTRPAAFSPVAGQGKGTGSPRVLGPRGLPVLAVLVLAASGCWLLIAPGRVPIWAVWGLLGVYWAAFLAGVGNQGQGGRVGLPFLPYLGGLGGLGSGMRPRGHGHRVPVFVGVGQTLGPYPDLNFPAVLVGHPFPGEQFVPAVFTTVGRARDIAFRGPSAVLSDEVQMIAVSVHQRPSGANYLKPDTGVVVIGSGNVIDGADRPIVGFPDQVIESRRLDILQSPDDQDPHGSGPADVKPGGQGIQSADFLGIERSTNLRHDVIPSDIAASVGAAVQVQEKISGRVLRRFPERVRLVNRCPAIGGAFHNGDYGPVEYGRVEFPGSAGHVPGRVTRLNLYTASGRTVRVPADTYKGPSLPTEADNFVPVLNDPVFVHEHEFHGSALPVGVI